MENSVMTPGEFYKKMLSIKNEYFGTYGAHLAMDNLMCNLLEDLGYEKGVEVFDSVDKWYT